MNVLVVDDHEENRYLLASLFKGKGHVIQTAANGAEALEIIKSGGVELIISDILMPVMDGFKLCLAVKNDENLRAIPFIIYTATYTGPQDETFAMKIGANRFIIRPCEPEVFLKSVDEVMAEAALRGKEALPKLAEEEDVFKLYSERLVRKLEQKMLEAEREIQARMAAENGLRESQKRLIAAQRIAKMGDFTWDVETGRVTWSDAMFDLLKYDKTTTFNFSRVNSQIHHPADLERINQWLNECLASGQKKLTPNEYRIICSDGEILYIRTEGIIERKTGESPRVFATIQDITERRQAEEALKKSEEGYKVLIENAGEVVLVAQDWQFKFSNRRVFDFLGVTPEELSGKTFLEYIHPEDRQTIAERHAKRLQGEHTPGIYSCRLIDKAGRTRWAKINSVLIDWEGKPATLNFLEDITERKFAEEEQEKLRRQLMQSQKVAAIGRLAGGVAHDFNNILSIILGYGEIMLAKIHPGDPLREDIQQIVNAGRRSAELTHQLLAFSRKQTLKPEALDLNSVVLDLEKMLRRLIGENIALTMALAEDLAHILADPGQIEQVIMNLAVNARDAMPAGGKLVMETANVVLDEDFARLHPGTVPGNYALLAVTDTGCGMDEDTMAQIFEPFFTSKEEGKGTGLGLSTVYGIVKQTGGNIYVHSEPGNGTTFKIYLPRTEELPKLKATGTAKEALMGGNEHILVVEDEESLRKLMDAILSRLGFKVTLAENGGAALSLMEDEGLAPDLVITDMVMPGISGAMMVDRLRRNRPNLEVLYMSGYTEDTIVNQGVHDPWTSFIHKPFSIKDLALKVREALQRKDASFP